jgi:V-type H+-transporting ATPase subunit H
MDEVRQLYAFIVEQLRRRDVPVELHIGLIVLQDLLGKNEMRSFFYQEGGVELLTSVVEGNPSAQIIYETVVSIWLLNYNSEVATRIGEFRVVQILVGLLKSQTKEKVVRVTIAALRNLSNKADNNETMIDHGMIRVLQTLNNKKWADEEIIADLEALTASVSATVNTMSSWDRYTKELSSGKLEWTPVHHNENFWRDNAAKFEEQGYTHLNMLHELIKGRDAQSRAIACFDLGEFARFHPQGKQILQRLGIKVDIMGLLTDDDAAVRKEALFAVQKTIPNYKFMV